MQIRYMIIHGFPIVRTTIHSSIAEDECMIFAMLKNLPGLIQEEFYL